MFLLSRTGQTFKNVISRAFVNHKSANEINIFFCKQTLISAEERYLPIVMWVFFQSETDCRQLIQIQDAGIDYKPL